MRLGQRAAPHRPLRPVCGLLRPRGHYGYRGLVRDSGNVAGRAALGRAEREEPVAYLSFNRNGYSTYCRVFREYWEWVAKRNAERYQNTVQHGKNYDAKNMLHVFRLLQMAEEIAVTGQLQRAPPQPGVSAANSARRVHV
ncbi:MAG: hypothetical protein WKG07_47255 [Hymenobacter sp.]